MGFYNRLNCERITARNALPKILQVCRLPPDIQHLDNINKFYCFMAT
jgi:hypothetical protein